MKKFTRTCNCCGSKVFIYDKKTKQYICDYCKNPYEHDIKPKEEKKEESSDEHMTVREIIGALIGLAIIIGGICAIIHIVNLQKENSQEPTTQQSVIQEPVEIVQEPIIEEVKEPELEPADDSIPGQIEGFLQTMAPILALPLMLCFLITFCSMAREMFRNSN